VRTNRCLIQLDEALLLYSQISALPDPDTFNMLSLKNWLLRRDCGNAKVRGEGGNAWGDLHVREEKQTRRSFWTLLWALIFPGPAPPNHLDLVVTRPQKDVDGFTRWIVCHAIPFYYERCKRSDEQKQEKRERAQTDIEKNSRSGALATEQSSNSTPAKDTIQRWSERSALRVTTGISMVVACLLPVAAIAVLANMDTTRDLILCLAGFTVLFAVGLMFVAAGTISRVEIFTATAA
jgi:hypothetical protein